jgi:hypothetical protein
MSIRITTAASALAAIRARQHVKAELQRKGEKVSHYAAKEISRMAQSYLALHSAELMPDCIARARAMILSGRLGKRAQRALCAKLKTTAQPEATCSNKQISVQMLGAK